jgi:germacradienol/geosmin synthase
VADRSSAPTPPDLPHPARLNPHADAARTRVRTWAWRMGLLDDPALIAALDARDHGLLAAYTHPACDVDALCLVTDWYVWEFFLRDHLRRAYAESRDAADPRDRLARLTSFLTTTGPPEPSNPVERGLADLWPRTVRGWSREWRERFAAGTRGLLDGALWELRRAGAGRIPNPLEYLRVRRRSGTARWAAGLAERANGAEVPARLAATWPLRTIADSFADAAHLCDDLHRYASGDIGEVTNGVLVLGEFLGLTPREAAAAANDLVAARIQRFEDAVGELPALYAGRSVSTAERAAVDAQVRALRDWQAGRASWHRRPGRRAHPTVDTAPASGGPGEGPGDGLGEGTPRTPGGGMPRTPGEPFRLPHLATPWQALANRHLESARRYAKAWAYEMGMIGPLAVRGDGVWTDARFDAQEFALLAALTNPTAEREVLHLLVLWDVWAFALDDFTVAEYRARRDLAGARAFVAGLPRFLTERPPVAANCVERGLADLWGRTAPRLPAGVRERFVSSVRAFAEGELRELAGTLSRRVPDPVEYADARRRTAGGELIANLGFLTAWGQIPADLRDARPIHDLLSAFADAIAFHNDIFSYRREVDFEFDLNNGVHVLADFFGCGPGRAAGVAADAAGVSLEEFQRIAAEELPALFAGSDLGAAAREQVRSFVRGLELWLAGDLAWRSRTRRYTGAGGPVRAVSGPVRIDTSTAPSSLDTDGHTARP